MSGYRVAFAGILASALAACAAEPPIRLPSPPAVPAPMPNPAAAVLLTSDQLYVIDSDVDVIVLASPAGLVSLSSEAGPVKIRGKFVGGTGRTESKTFKGKQVVTVEALKSGTVELLIVPVGAKSADDVIRRTISVDAGEGPRPPPEPPGPKPPEPPQPVKSFQVLIVFESGATYTAAQNGVLYGKAVEDYLTARCTGGKAGWGRRDKDTDPAADTSGLKALWAAVKPKVTGVPCLAIAVNETVTLEPLPATPAEAVALLKKYAGDK